MPAIPTSATRETGYNTGLPLLGNSWLTGSQQIEYSPDEREHLTALAWPNSVPVFTAMRADGKVQEVLAATTLPILRARRWLDPNGAPRDVVEHIARDLNVPILGDPDSAPRPRSRGRFNTTEHLRLALELALTYGHMPFEQVYAIDTSGERPLARLRKLAPRMPETIAEIVVERDGGLKGIRQNASGWSAGAGTRLGLDPLIPVSSLVFYSHKREGAAWQGRSILRGAYRAWRMKDDGWRIWATSMRKNGMGHPVYEGAPGETDTQLQAGALLAQQAQTGESAGVGVPNGATIRFRGVEGTLPDHAAFLRYCDEEIAGSMLAEFLKLGTSATGSRALGESFVDFFVLAQQALAEWLLGTFNEHVIEDLVDLNWGEDVPAPRLVAEEVGSDHRLTAEAITALVTSGAIQADPALDAYLRDTYRLPARSGAPSPAPEPPAPATPAAPTDAADPQVMASREHDVAAAAAASAPTARARDLNGHEIAAAIDVDAIDAAWTSRLEQLLQTWLTVRSAQVDELVTQVETIAATGDLAKVAGIAASTGGGQVALEQAMRDMVAAAVTEAVAEAARQGVTIAIPSSDALTAGIPARAMAVEDLLASGLSNAAKRSALVHLGAGIAASEVAAAVREHLEGLTDTYLREQLGGALTAAQNEGRLQVMASGPVAHYYASELLDGSTCDNCAAEDERQFTSLAEARKAYPTGGFRDCLGGARCRGTVVAVYAEEQPATVQQPGKAA